MAGTDLPSSRIPVHPDVSYEHTDISSRGVVLIAAGTLVGAWFFAWLLYYFFAFLMHYRAEAGPLPETRAVGKILLPSEPRLQVSSTGDMQQLRATEDAQLHNYGWIDRPNGVVRIPIERAIQLTVQRGIPPLRSPLKVCPKDSPTWQAGVGGIDDPMMICPPKAGTRDTGLEGKVEPEPR